MEKDTRLCTSYELLRSNRFIVKFPHTLNIPDWLVITCTLPVEKYNGDITVTLRCPVLLDIDKERPHMCIEGFDMEIDFLARDGSVLDGYILKDCKINEVKNTDLNYTHDEIIESTINISYKECTAKKNELIGVLFITDKN